MLGCQEIVFLMGKVVFFALEGNEWFRVFDGYLNWGTFGVDYGRVGVLSFFVICVCRVGDLCAGFGELGFKLWGYL